LVKVWLLDGHELWVLIHVEIQGNRDSDFAERMFTCQYRALVLSLPEELDNQFWTDLSNFEENRKMPYITSVERIGEERGRLMGIQIGEQRGIQIGEQRGIQIGEQRGEAKVLTRLLQRRFGPLPDWAQEQISQADSRLLEAWSIQILDAQTLDEVFASTT
ncbi:MAG: DUF4351 domain-containing protein, partial [Magnetococcales bacterium]|nr:DUF4351 domain-containing protein [Magnetococcales bacterium]